MFWNVRTTPRRAALYGTPESARPSIEIRPLVGGKTPDRQLSSVVLPDPFGPINPTICPSASDRLTPLSASTPPKRFPTDSASRVTARIYEGGSPFPSEIRLG